MIHLNFIFKHVFVSSLYFCALCCILLKKKIFLESANQLGNAGKIAPSKFVVEKILQEHSFYIHRKKMQNETILKSKN